jgi:RND family efflux transporter MFP subunit
MQVPRRRLTTFAAIAVVALAALTLVQWPLRVRGEQPRFRPAERMDVRALVPGVIERVLVSEGSTVSRGAPIALLRDPALQADRASVAAEAIGADRAASRAASRGDIAEEQLQRARSAALSREAALLGEQESRLLVRAPTAGVVLSERPEERVGTRVNPGDLLVTVGRTDSLELEFGVNQRDVARIGAGQGVRLRVDALPQRTFAGRVVSVAALPADTAAGAFFPVRAMVENPDGVLRPGMTAYARVLTDRASLAERVLRAPVRWIRLLWWRAQP